MGGMTKRKTSITVDPEKAARAERLLGTANFSETVDRALDALIRQERRRLDLEAYAATPETPDERALMGTTLSGVDDDTDWSELYGDLL
jgi:Arc/MetJ family transcription regulator